MAKPAGGGSCIDPRPGACSLDQVAVTAGNGPYPAAASEAKADLGFRVKSQPSACCSPVTSNAALGSRMRRAENPWGVSWPARPGRVEHGRKF